MFIYSRCKFDPRRILTQKYTSFNLLVHLFISISTSALNYLYTYLSIAPSPHASPSSLPFSSPSKWQQINRTIYRAFPFLKFLLYWVETKTLFTRKWHDQTPKIPRSPRSETTTLHLPCHLPDAPPFSLLLLLSLKGFTAKQTLNTFG